MIEFINKYYLELQFALTFGGILLLLLIESLFPRRQKATDQQIRWVNNIGLTLLNFYLLMFFGIAYASTSFAVWLQPETPLFSYLQLPTAITVVATIFCFELLSYCLHRVFHRVPLLWRIHAVHHTDTEIDVSTSFRHHPFEGMIFTLLSLPLMVWLGVPVVAAISYNAIRLLVSMLTHANIAIPEKLDNILRLFIVTPDFHRIHHSSEQHYTDSNYGVITPWFDYLFRSATRLPYKDLTDMELGLKYLRQPEDSRIDRLLLLPFTWKGITRR